MKDIDERMEQDIKALSLEAPRIEPEHIQAMCEDVTYVCTVVPTTNSTLCTAVYKGWTLCTVEMACVSKENFNAALGRKYAIEKCKPVAKDELWKLEGWRLKLLLITGEQHD